VKAVRGKGSEERGRVLWDATSRGLCHTVDESDPAHNKVWANASDSESPPSQHMYVCLLL